MVGDVSEEWLERQDVPVLDFSRKGNNCTLRATKAAPRGKNCDTEARRGADECILASSRVPKLESRLSLFQEDLIHADQSQVRLGSRPARPS
jgi:hypothetical protein